MASKGAGPLIPFFIIQLFESVSYSFTAGCSGDWMEFGVFNGDTINLAASSRRRVCGDVCPPVFGFDTFTGLSFVDSNFSLTPHILVLKQHFTMIVCLNKHRMPLITAIRRLQLLDMLLQGKDYDRGPESPPVWQQSAAHLQIQLLLMPICKLTLVYACRQVCQKTGCVTDRTQILGRTARGHST